MPEPITREAHSMGTLGEAARIVSQSDAPSAHLQTADKTYCGTIACYISPSTSNKTRLHVNIRDDLYRSFNHAGALRVTRMGTDTFQIEPHPDADRKTPRFHREGATWGFTVYDLVTIEEGAFGASTTEMILVDGSIVARVLERRKITALASEFAAHDSDAAGPTPARRVNTPSRAALFRGSLDPREVLAALRWVEAETPYRLVRIKDETGGHWAFQAPRIE